MIKIRIVKDLGSLQKRHIEMIHTQMCCFKGRSKHAKSNDRSASSTNWNQYYIDLTGQIDSIMQVSQTFQQQVSGIAKTQGEP